MPCFRKTPVAEKFMDKKGGFQDFLSKIFCLTEPENSVGGGEFFSVSLLSGIAKLWTRGGRGVSRFSVGNFLSHSAENLSTMESFNVWLISGIERLYASEGYVTIF